MKRIRVSHGFTRATIVLLSFTMDIKVRADVTIHSATGHVDIQSGENSVAVKQGQKILEPFEIQTFGGSIAKVSVNSMDIGLNEKTFLTVGKRHEVNLYWGTCLLHVPPGMANNVMIKTHQGEVTTKGGEFLVSVKNSKTVVSVISGDVIIEDRSTSTIQRLRSGYRAWLGGLLATGAHARGTLEALDLNLTIEKLKLLGSYDSKEIQSRYDHLRPHWRQAVTDVATETQDQISGDLQTYHEIQVVQEKRRLRELAEEAGFRRHFRDRATGEEFSK